MNFRMNDGTKLAGELRPLWWHNKGLSYTASGYGQKIPTRWMVTLGSRKYRVYCAVWSNTGTYYICRNGQGICDSNVLC